MWAMLVHLHAVRQLYTESGTGCDIPVSSAISNEKLPSTKIVMPGLDRHAIVSVLRGRDLWDRIVRRRELYCSDDSRGGCLTPCRQCAAVHDNPTMIASPPCP
jgi:hypothetical protein